MVRVRRGYVTNSSSSSFILARKQPLTDEELRDRLWSIIGVDEQHLLHGFAESIVNIIMREIENNTTYTNDMLIDYIRDYDPYDNEDIMLVFIREYGNAVMGRIDGNSENAAENWLCMNDLYYEDDDLIIEHEGGF